MDGVASVRRRDGRGHRSFWPVNKRKTEMKERRKTMEAGRGKNGVELRQLPCRITRNLLNFGSPSHCPEMLSEMMALHRGDAALEAAQGKMGRDNEDL